MTHPTTKESLQTALRHHRDGQLAEAERLYRQVLAREPGHAEALHFLGVVAAQTGRTDAAVELIGRAVALRPGDAEALYNFGKALGAVGRHDDAIDAYRRAVALEPGRPDGLNNLGVALQARGRTEEAVEAFRRAASLMPPNPEAYNNLGSALWAVSQTDAAIAAYRRAMALRPDYADAHTNLALALLSRGDFAPGWEEYEWRWRCGALAAARRDFRRPPWDGRPLAGRTILLHAEQGFGDTLQFVRYVPLVAGRGGKVVVECQAELLRLIRSLPADFTAVACGQPLPDFHCHCPFMSLPRLFGTTLDNIPGRSPFLHAEPEAARRWRERFAREPAALKVGLAWAGSRSNTRDHERSVPPSALAPLFAVDGVRFYSLQKGEPAGPHGAPPGGSGPAGLGLTGPGLTDWTGELRDFADTAALMASLDLVISVDTAVAHLAGATGRAAWVLLSSAPHWCWLLERSDSPWYPTARLFRQTKRGEWGTVIERVAEALGGLARRRPL